MHIGNHIRNVLKSQGRTVEWFSTQLCYTRNHIYKIFNKSTIDTGLLARISKILGHDFFADISVEQREESK